MTSISRRKKLGKDRKGVYHCSTRCVRRARLCGEDPLTGKDFSYRRLWIMNREEQLAELFAIDIEFRAEMSNHLHLMLRARPEIAKRIPPREVIRRWLTITKIAKCMSDEMPEPSECRIDKMVKDKKRVKKLRKRLSSISWFMGILLENIARRSNKEDECTGKFWEARFRCRECTDTASILLCAIYIDLNPIKAGEADGPETAYFTSIYQRIQASSEPWNKRNRADGWMGELTLKPERKADEEWAYKSRTGRRASDLGILPISLEDYLKLLKWTAKMILSGERETIPKNLASILDRLNLNEQMWVDVVDCYDSTFCHAVGAPDTLEEVAQRLDVKRLKGTAACRRAFT